MTDPAKSPSPTPPRKAGTGRLVLALSLVVLGLVIALAVRNAFFVPRPVEAQPDIGGPFTLTDHTGRTVTDGDFKGRYLLVYFGYTFCPDVCPTGLTTMTEALTQAGPAAEKVTPLFVTVDPARDTAAQMATYVKHFHPRLIGLTGTAEQIAAVAKSYRVYYARAPHQGGDPDAYMMDHSSFFYLMGPDGKFRALFGHATPVEEMAKRIREVVK
jgi:protein SCO1/2